MLSAKTASALEQASQNLSAYLQEHAELPLQDAAYTCQLGREPLVHRRTVVAATIEEAAKLLTKPEPSRVSTGQAAASAPGVVFMFSGQGSQYVNMGRELYETEPVFRAQVDHCAERLIPDLGLDLRTLCIQQKLTRQRQRRSYPTPLLRSPRCSASNMRWRNGGWRTESRLPQ